MNPNDIDLTNAQLAATATSEGDGRERFTVLNVWYVPDHSRPWVAEALGVSTLPGEVTKTRRLASASLERAMRLLDDSDLGVIVKEGAREWAQEHGAPVLPRGGLSAACDREALALLFGVGIEAVSISAAAVAFNMGESTLRMSMKDGRDIRVPLRRLLPYLDRAAFRRDFGAEVSRG
jgi:hypothetical protein